MHKQREEEGDEERKKKKTHAPSFRILDIVASISISLLRWRRVLGGDDRFERILLALLGQEAATVRATRRSRRSQRWLLILGGLSAIHGEAGGGYSRRRNGEVSSSSCL